MEPRSQDEEDDLLTAVVIELGVDTGDRLEFFWIPHLANLFLYICCLPARGLDYSSKEHLDLRLGLTLP